MAPRPKATTMEDKRSLLKILHKASPKLKKALLADLPSEIVQLLSECALNILKGTVILKKGQKARLRRHRKNLHDLAKTKTPLKKKKEIIQKGGFLPSLLAGILPGLIPTVVQGLSDTVTNIIRPPRR